MTRHRRPSETRLTTRFRLLREQKKAGFIAYLTAGDPDVERTFDDVLLLERAGVDIVELGLPFSDPLADGPVNQESAQRALDAGVTLSGILEMVRALRKKTEIPIMCYCYLNLLYAPGFERTVRRAAAAGVDGMLILDLPLEESATYTHVLRAVGMDPICLITPTTPEARIRRIVREASGFVYAVSRTGVTGMQSSLANEAAGLVTTARRHTHLPIALGFGISTPLQAAQAAQLADAVVVGSAIVKRLHEGGRSPAKRKAIQQWVYEMVQAVKEV